MFGGLEVLVEGRALMGALLESLEVMVDLGAGGECLFGIGRPGFETFSALPLGRKPSQAFLFWPETECPLLLLFVAGIFSKAEESESRFLRVGGGVSDTSPVSIDESTELRNCGIRAS